MTKVHYNETVFLLVFAAGYFKADFIKGATLQPSSMGKDVFLV